jgi:hypothetical protein
MFFWRYGEAVKAGNPARDQKPGRRSQAALIGAL